VTHFLYKPKIRTKISSGNTLGGSATVAMPLRSNEPIFSSIPSSTNLEQLKKALEEEQKAAYPVNIRSLIAAQQVGCIIGKKGVTIQHIQNYYGVNITFIGDKKATPSYRLLHIAGSSPRCTEALKYCLKRITEDDMRQERIVVCSISSC
jgi:predicted PilT family ATPase